EMLPGGCQAADDRLPDRRGRADDGYLPYRALNHLVDRMEDGGNIPLLPGRLGPSRIRVAGGDHADALRVRRVALEVHRGDPAAADHRDVENPGHGYP